MTKTTASAVLEECAQALESARATMRQTHDRLTGRAGVYDGLHLTLLNEVREINALLPRLAAALAEPAIPEGYVLVPKEPTEEMHIAARDWSAAKYGKPIGKDASDGCWRVMLAARPTSSTPTHHSVTPPRG